MQKPHRPVRDNKLPLVLQCCIGQAIEIFKISGLPIAMVTCLHQCSVYIIGKLRVWRAQHCNFLVSAKTAATGTGHQTSPCHVAPYCASKENFQNFWATFCHGTVFVPIESLYYKEATGVESRKMQFPSQCKNRTDRCGSTNYPVPCSTVLGKQ